MMTIKHCGITWGMACDSPKRDGGRFDSTAGAWTRWARAGVLI